MAFSTLPTLTVGDRWDWDQASEGAHRAALANAIGQAITTRRWFGAKARAVARLEIIDTVPVNAAARILLVGVHYASGPAEVYQIPLGFAAGDADHRTDADATPWIAVESDNGRTLGVLYDALVDTSFCRELLALFDAPRTLGGTKGELVAERTGAFDALRGARSEPLAPKPVRSEQSNSSVTYGARLILKAFRRIETGLNPDFELTAFLSRKGFANTPQMAGSLAYRPSHGEPWALGMLQAFVPNQGDAWQFTLAWLAAELNRLQRPTSSRALPPTTEEGVVRAAEQPIPAAVRASIGEFLSQVELLGTRTAEMHLALAAEASDPAFAPQPFSEADRSAYFGRARDEARKTFALLGEHIAKLTGPAAQQARKVLALAHTAKDHFERLAREPGKVCKIRCHGDYHLGQVLVADGDFVVIDFEGEPARPLSERREKQLALRDVAGMIRSLHYASCAAVAAMDGSADDGRIKEWAEWWYAWSSAAFLAAYRRKAADAPFLPAARDEFERLLDGCLLEKAIYELRYELDNRPDWVHLPLAALADLLS